MKDRKEELFSTRSSNLPDQFARITVPSPTRIAYRTHPKISRARVIFVHDYAERTTTGFIGRSGIAFPAEVCSRRTDKAVLRESRVHSRTLRESAVRICESLSRRRCCLATRFANSKAWRYPRTLPRVARASSARGSRAVPRRRRSSVAPAETDGNSRDMRRGVLDVRKRARSSAANPPAVDRRGQELPPRGTRLACPALPSAVPSVCWRSR